MFFLDTIWLIPLLPAMGAVAMFFFGRKMSNRAVSIVCVGSVVLAFALACGAVWQYTDWAHAQPGKPFEKILFTWLGTGTGELAYVGAGNHVADFRADAGFLLDPLSSIWLLFVTGVGMLIHIYSIGYMGHEGGYYRFFGFLNLFMFSMLMLVLGNNYAIMFVGWEGVGLCSYLLIGFYFDRQSATTAANKAFIVNRVGDAAFLLGMFTIAWYFGSVQYTRVNEMVHEGARSGAFAAGDPIITLATLLLFAGACGKSAQLPLYTWLPDAMEGPTPVSALIHAATMVTAGVYMVARSNALFQLAPTSMTVVAVVGALTAIFAATIGLVQNDIKRVLAYSTVSQLGYMFLALGVGAFAAGVFHVFTHAFFKALLFLGAGSVIHALSGEQDLRNMGALADKTPTTYKTMLVATLAIAGIPPLAGFFSKDEILWQAWLHQPVLWGLGFVTAILTAFYMYRLFYLTFWSPARMSHEVEHHAHESPASMTMPLVVLAAGAALAGFLGFPESLARLVGIHANTNRFEHFLEPVFERVGAVREAAPGVEQGNVEYALMVASFGAAAVGWFLAKRFYSGAGKDYAEPIAQAAPPVYQTLFNKYWVDELYDMLFTGRRKFGPVRMGALGAGEASRRFDELGIDGAVNATGWLTRLSGTISMWWDKWIIDGLLVNGLAIVTRTLSYPARLVQWGLVQWYALVMVAGVTGMILYYVRR